MNIYDYLTITENHSGKNPEDVINLIKRYNNPKRSFLFENKFLGKTYPQKADKILDHFKRLYDLTVSDLKGRKILIVGFAETATALAQFFSYQSTVDNELSVVYHLQTTRETLPAVNKLVFLEEHSHAAQHDIVFTGDIPEFDTILFVEDEISTGNTILNFIKLFEQVRPNSNYAVASLFNWQNEVDAKRYLDLGIKTYCLLRGELKNDINQLTTNTPGEVFEYPLTDNYSNVITEGPRLGMTPGQIEEYFTIYPPHHLPMDKVLVIGTEENMFKPLLLANLLTAEFMATTRSPLTVSADEGYYPKNVFILPSFYDSSRKTYLYNLNKHYDSIVVVLESGVDNQDFVDTMSFILKDYTNNLIFVNEGELCL